MGGWCIRYTSGYKYQLSEDYHVYVDIVGTDIRTDYIDLGMDGFLSIRKGYAWDGPSGPTIDTKNFMRGSLVHDALYQLMRMRKLPISDRDLTDRELRKICREDGMSAIRAWWVYRGVSLAGASAASPSNAKAIHTAP